MPGSIPVNEVLLAQLATHEVFCDIESTIVITEVEEEDTTTSIGLAEDDDINDILFLYFQIPD